MLSALLSGIVPAATPVLSPDGSRAAFVVTRNDLKTNKRKMQIWVADTDGSTAPRPLTNGTDRDHSPAWSPDGSTLAFVSARTEKRVRPRCTSCR